MKIPISAHALVATAAVAIFSVAPASAQAPDVGWLPWAGCWEMPGAPEDAALCARPTAEQGTLELLRLQGGEVLAREVLWSDGARHETNREGCDGWEQGRFSADGRRLFYTSEHACDGSVRSGAGVMSLTAEGDWLDVRVLTVGGEPTAWVQRYVRAPVDASSTPELARWVEERQMSLRAARAAAAAPLDVEDVVEAASILPVEAVEAWVMETGDEFALDADALITLDETGVDDRVIDVMVAVSHPRSFQLEGRSIDRVADRGQAGAVHPVYGARSCFSSGYGWSPMFGARRGCGYSSWDRYGYGYGYGYSGYGISPYGYSPYSYGYRPVVVHVDRRRDAGGYAVPGRGYTQRGGAARPSQGTARPSTGSSTGGGAGASSSRGSSGSSGSARKAKRRGGGGK